jgi:AcrR family transcriptional regulator
VTVTELGGIPFGMVCRMVEPSAAARSSRTDWLDAGLALLAAEGRGAITVERLCARMGRTKGSFYHHFESRDAFVVALLERWEGVSTRQIIRDLAPLASPTARLRALGERTTREVDLRLERTIRLWADGEPAVAAVLARVDAAREGYLVEQFGAALGDPTRARLAARAHMALLVGTEMLYQNLSRTELADLHVFVDHLGFAPDPEPPR